VFKTLIKEEKKYLKGNLSPGLAETGEI